MSSTAAMNHQHPASEQGITIVIPAYNEENGIGPVLAELRSELHALGLESPLEVIIVNDGSKDKTGEAIAGHLSTYDDEMFRLVEHPQNRGYGAALKTGIRHATYPWILITDADGTYPNEHIKDVLPHRDAFDMIVGARTGEHTNIPLIRRPPKWVLRKMASVLSQQHIPDLNSGFRLMRKEVVERFFNILPNGFSFTTTITLAMFSTGHYVKYVPINYLKREGKSKIRPIADTLNFVKLIVRTVMYFDPLRIFVPVSLLFFVASVTVGYVSWAQYGQVADVTTVALFITSVHVFAIGMLADMLNRRVD
ncbi:MAG: glycosyltransferase family 2 protein [Myxococcota bacterium]